MSLRSLFLQEDRQYLPFVAGAIFFGLFVGFPLGFTLAHARAQSSTLGGHFGALSQAHGHIQILGWLGLFALGMGLRLVPRFTGSPVRPSWLPPLTLALVVSGLVLRSIAQPMADGSFMAGTFILAAALEAAGTLIFATAVLRSLSAGRRESFLYSPFFAAGAVWLVIGSLLDLAFVIDTASNNLTTMPLLRSLAVTGAQLQGFVLMFILAVSLRTFPIFFGRKPPSGGVTLAAWALMNLSLGGIVASFAWESYEFSDAVRYLQTVAFLMFGLSVIVLVGLLGIFRGAPHRLRASARRSMWLVRAAYFWLLVAGVLHVVFAVRAISEETFLPYYEVDAIRHFLALGFMTTMIIGMAFLVVPRLAMRRLQAQLGPRTAVTFLVLLQGATLGRGLGSLIVNEGEVANGFWTMSAGGLLAILLLLLFARQMARRPPKAEIPLATVKSEMR